MSSVLPSLVDDAPMMGGTPSISPPVFISYIRGIGVNGGEGPGLEGVEEEGVEVDEENLVWIDNTCAASDNEVYEV